MLSRLIAGLGFVLPFSLLTAGNAKLGRMLVWSLPAVATCPGRTKLCESRCYARRGYYNCLNVVERLFKNLAVCTSPFFVGWMVNSIRLQRAKLVRIHSAGDFFNVAYVRAWLQIIRARPDVQFYAYTRSWRVTALRPALALLARQPNMRLHYSCDRESGVPVPRKGEERVLIAYMAVTLDDSPPPGTFLVFRDYPTRGQVQKRMDGVLVCPAENGAGAHVTCDKCQVCFNPDRITRVVGAGTRHGEAVSRRRFPLEMVA